LILEPLASPSDLLFVNAVGQLVFETNKEGFSVGAADRFSKK